MPKHTKKTAASHTKKKVEPKKTNRIETVISVTRSGKGFLLVPDGDVVVFRENLGGALSGDLVEALITPRGKTKIGRVLKVLERKTNSFVGDIVKTPKGMMLRPDDGRVYFDFLIVGSSGAPEGHKAVLDILDWNTPTPQGNIRTVIGPAGNHEVEMQAIVLSKGFESGFPEAVLREAESLYERAWDEKEIKSRRDFRETLTFTIDPETAKDFDDAISYAPHPDGSMEIGIHIADVTYFVRPGTLIEKESYKRATSVYLVDRTVPMLPPQLSEDLCSLKPDVDRLAFSAIFTIKNNRVVSEWYGRTIIRSQKRFTYEQADTTLKDASLPLHTELNAVWKFASKLRTDRFEQGAIMFGSDEIKPLVDENGVVTGFKRSEYTESHQLIEELMLLANRSVATFVSKKLGAKSRLFVYRIHDVPNAEKLEELSVFLRAIGYQLENPNKATGRDINKLLKEVSGKTEERLIKTATIRSMAKAVYTTKNVGHYGLAFENYAHFTSPIRRYPDTMVHRMLAKILNGEKVTDDPAEQERRAVHASEREVSAAEAERASVKMKQVEYFANLIGKEREGVVSGVTEWGIYVSDNETAADGMVRLTTLTNDTYEYNPKKYAAVGSNPTNIIRLGDPVRFVVERADLEQHTLDFRLLI
ncbi:ribonuclease R [Patescibacteria group bacterium]|nr:MAG: ribonuclease R [Patescibacteria group bacterium]